MDVLYVKLKSCAEVDLPEVRVSDLASLTSTNNKIVNRIKPLRVFSFNDSTHTRYVVSMLKIVEIINKEVPGAQIETLGSDDCVVDYRSNKRQHKVFKNVKIVFSCLLIFFGAAFAIMSFNNDVSVEKLFDQMYTQAGISTNGFGVLEIGYSLGLALGIIIFYNHFGPKKLSTDPTPIEVEMRKYETDINNTLVEGHHRKDGKIDVE